MKKIFIFSMSILAALSFIRSSDRPVAPPKDKSSAEQPAIELKTKSVFALENGARSPFWPIGWKPTARVSNTGTEHAGVVTNLSPSVAVVRVPESLVRSLEMPLVVVL
jgi:hypothetical protein